MATSIAEVLAKQQEIKMNKKSKKLKTPATSYITNDLTVCRTCKEPTHNDSTFFKLCRLKRNWQLHLKCTECGKTKPTFLTKLQTSKLPADLRTAEEGSTITHEEYEAKFGGILPLLTLIPLIIKGVAAAAGAATAATGIASAVETARNNRAMEDIQKKALGQGFNENKVEQKIQKYVKFLQGHGFSFYF